MSRVVAVLAASSAAGLLAVAYLTLHRDPEPLASPDNAVDEPKPTRVAARSRSRADAPLVIAEPRLTLAQRRAVLPEWDEGDGRMDWLAAHELAPFTEVSPELASASQACRDVLSRLDSAVEGKRKLKRRTKHRIYREAREALANLSSHVDSENPDELSLLEETRAQLMMRMKRLGIEPPVGG